NTAPVKSNIVIFDLADRSADTFLDQLKGHHILAVPFGPQTIRFTTHLEVDDTMIDRVIEVLKKLADAPQ
ncbi:MAG: threonine aldolase, partial [Bacteroidota bacterium]